MYIFFKKSIILCLSLFIIISIPQLAISYSVKFNSDMKDFILVNIFFKNDISSFSIVMYKNLKIILLFLLSVSSTSVFIALSFKNKFIKFYFCLITVLIFVIYFSLSMLSLYGIYESYFRYLICIVSIITYEYYYNFFKFKLIGNK